MPGALEDGVEVTPAANERVEAQRVGLGGGLWPQCPCLAPSPFPASCFAARRCGKLSGSFRVCQNAPREKGYVLRERAPAEEPEAHAKVRVPRAGEPLRVHPGSPLPSTPLLMVG